MKALYANVPDAKYGSGDTSDKVQNLMNSIGKMGSFLYNTTPIGRVVDYVDKGMKKS
jgi:hypothetical protein